MLPVSSSMAVFPLPKRIRSFHGPHSTCVLSAETYLREYTIQNKEKNIYIHLGKGLTFTHFHFTVYFCGAMMFAFCFTLFALSFIIGYGLMKLFLRFQYKLTILLLLMRTRVISFKDVNNAIIYWFHVVMVLTGGFGWLFLLFIDL